MPQHRSGKGYPRQAFALVEGRDDDIIEFIETNPDIQEMGQAKFTRDLYRTYIQAKATGDMGLFKNMESVKAMPKPKKKPKKKLGIGLGGQGMFKR